MENKKPQSPSVPPKAPKQTPQAKPSQSVSAKTTQPTRNTQEKQNQPTPTKAAQSAQTAQTKTNQSEPAKDTQPMRNTQARQNQPTPTKTAQSAQTAQVKQTTPQKSQSVAPTKATQPTQKKPNTVVKTKGEGVKQPAPAKPQSLVAKAPAAKAPILPKTDASSNQSKPKTAPESKPASVPKVGPEVKPAPVQKALPEEKLAVKEQVKVPEQKTESKSAPADLPSSKPSTLVKLATKGFVIQSWQIAVAVAVVLVLVVGGILLGTVLGNQNTDDPIVDYTGPLVNQNPDDPSNIALPGYPELVFPANSKKVTLELPNPSGNPCYFQYTLTLVETGEALYESEPIQPGKMVKELTLNRSLPVGTYTLRIEIDTFSLADATTPMNGGVQEVKLIVK